MELTIEEELQLLRNSHLITSRIESNIPIKKDQIRVLEHLFPRIYGLLLKVQAEDLFAMYERYKDHPVFQKDTELLLSPTGKEWVELELSIVKSYAESKK